MLRKTQFLLFVFFCVLTGYAQDIHFSQFYASPLNLNPALTGFSEGSYRVAGIYRNQWRSVTTPYETYSGSFDMKVLEEKLNRDIFGLGGVIVNDRSGDGKLGLLSIMASTSYLKLLGNKSKHYLGAGLQFGYVQRSLDFNNLTFPHQYDSNSGDFDLSLSNNENFDGSNISYFDLQAGVLWSSNVHERIGLFNGLSIFHLTQPKESFLNDDTRLKSRYAFHGGIKIKATENIFFTPNYIIMLQNKAQEFNAGAAIEYHFQDDHLTIVSLGGWYRVEDAAILTASVEHRGIRIGLSYDVNTSELKPASNNRGAFEISLIYIGKIAKDDGPIMVPCPRL